MKKNPLHHLLSALLVAAFATACQSDGNVGGAGGAANLNTMVLTDANGNPLTNVFWSIENGGGSGVGRTALSGGAVADVVAEDHEDSEGDHCTISDSATPQVDNQTADADGCTNSDGEMQYACTGDFTLNVDAGNGNVYSQEVACGAGSSSGSESQEVQFDEIEGTSATRLVLYSGGTSDGLFGDRAASDATCALAAPEGVDAANAHAFLSYSESDDLAGLAANLGLSTSAPVESIGGTLIAHNWADIFDGEVLVSFDEAGVVEGYSKGGYWTGATASGGVSEDNCHGWTSNFTTSDLATAIEYHGRMGYGFDATESEEGGYLDGDWSSPCAYEREFLCVAPAAE